MKILRRYAVTTVLMLAMLAATVGGVLAQEEAAAAEANGLSTGWMIAILGVGLLVVLGLGAAMNAQADEERQTQEEA